MGAEEYLLAINRENLIMKDHQWEKFILGLLIVMLLIWLLFMLAGCSSLTGNQGHVRVINGCVVEYAGVEAGKGEKGEREWVVNDDCSVRTKQSWGGEEKD